MVHDLLISRGSLARRRDSQRQAAAEWADSTVTMREHAVMNGTLEPMI